MRFLLIKPGNQKNIGRLFINAPSTEPSLGLLYLGAVLEKDGHKVEILDYYMEDVSREQLEKSLMSSNAVGMTIVTDDYTPALNISRVIKEIDPDIPLIIGGPHCIFFQKKSLSDFPCADISIVSEGERVILDLVNYLQGKKKLADIHGVYYRNNGLIKSGKPSQAIDNLDEVPFPARHLVDKYDYGDFPFGYHLKKKVTAIITSRGCPFSCRFCSRYSNFIKELNFRARSAENVVKEIQELDGKYRSVLIVDDSFLIDNKRAHKIFDMLLEIGTNIEFLIRGTRVDSADRELYIKMKKAGVVFISYGIESGTQDVLDFYNKNITLKQIQDAVNLGRKMGFFTIGNFILGAQIETKEYIENTINFACSLPLDMISITPLGYVMGSQLWKEEVENGKIPKNTLVTTADSRRGLGNFTKEELIAYMNQANKSFYLRPTYIVSQIYRSILRKDYSLLFNGLKFLFMLKGKSNA
jgi:anaerobic magnesium-protoporphyrin IX monomethyl ester cyclase